MSSRHRSAFFLLLLVSCSDTSRSVDYVRIVGAAPRLEDAPIARALLVVFWATWCPPCREETPGLRALAENPPEGLRVVVVSQDLTVEAVEDFFDGAPDSSLHLRLDADKKLFNAFGVDTLPVSFLAVGGELRARFTGARRWDSRDMRALLERLTREEEKRP